MNIDWSKRAKTIVPLAALVIVFAIGSPKEADGRGWESYIDRVHENLEREHEKDEQRARAAQKKGQTQTTNPAAKKQPAQKQRRSGSVFKKGMESTGNRTMGLGLGAERD